MLNSHTLSNSAAAAAAMWRASLRLIARKGRNTPASRIVLSRVLSGQAGSIGRPSVPKIGVREARDTSDLIDQLLWVLGPVDSRESGFVFFDLDETLVTRDTCLIDGLGSTRKLMSRMEAKLGASSETLRTIHREMERDYYSADPKLVDPLLVRVIRALKIQGHSVFGLTSNALDLVHAPQILETLAKYKIRFSAPDVRGELPRSGALVMDHPVCRGVIFIDNQQAVRHDKGEVIAEFVGLLLHNANDAIAAQDGEGRGKHSEEGKGGWTKLGDGLGIGGSGGGGGGGEIGAVSRRLRRRKCILVDNTSKKCERASESFARHAAAEFLELHTLHFTEAENLVESPDAVNQLRRILGRLRARGLIGVDLVAEDILVSPESSDRFRTAVSAAASADPKEGVIAEPQRG